MQWDLDKHQIRAARQKRKVSDISPDEVEEIDVIVRNAREKLEIPVEQAMPCATRARISTAKTQTMKVAGILKSRNQKRKFGRLLLDAKKRTAECIVVIWT